MSAKCNDSLHFLLRRAQHLLNFFSFFFFFCCRKLLEATILTNKTGHFMWVGSDSWGAKAHPVRGQEYAAEGAITILPYRNRLKGER